MIVATFPGRVVPPEIYMALKFGTGFLGVNLRARELGGRGTPDYRDGSDDRRVFWDLKFSISGFFGVGEFRQVFFWVA